MAVAYDHWFRILLLLEFYKITVSTRPKAFGAEWVNLVIESILSFFCQNNSLIRAPGTKLAIASVLILVFIIYVPEYWNTAFIFSWKKNY